MFRSGSVCSGLRTGGGWSGTRRVSSRRFRGWFSAFGGGLVARSTSGGLWVLCLALLRPCAGLSSGIALWLAGRLGLCDGPCPNLLRGDGVLIFVPSDFWSGLLRPSDLSSLPDGRSIACPIRMSLHIFCYIIFVIYALRVSVIVTSTLRVAVGLLSM